MKKMVKYFLALFMLGSVFTNRNIEVSANVQESITESNVVLEHEGDYKIVVIKEEVEDGVIYKEYHDSVLVDSLFVKNENGAISPQTNDNIQNTRANPYLSGTTKLGSVYYNVAGFSNQIRMDLRYKQDGAPAITTYTVKNQYATALAFAIDLAAYLFMPQSLCVKLVDKLIANGIVAVSTNVLQLIGSCKLNALAQNQYLYAYIPLQAPDQPEVYRTFTGTNYRITETNHRLENTNYYTGYATNGWGTTALGVNLGNNFFNSYCTVARWVK